MSSPRTIKEGLNSDDNAFFMLVPEIANSNVIFPHAFIYALKKYIENNGDWSAVSRLAEEYFTPKAQFESVEKTSKARLDYALSLEKAVRVIKETAEKLETPVT